MSVNYIILINFNLLFLYIMKYKLLICVKSRSNYLELWLHYNYEMTDCSYFPPKFGIKKNERNINLPLGLYLRWSSINWQGQRAETQCRGGTDKPAMSLLRSCESITRSSLRRTKWCAHRDAYLSNSNSARSCQHIPSSFRNLEPK